MSFFDENIDYIKKTAEIRAKEIAIVTGRISDRDDYRQDIYLYIAAHAHKYDSHKSKPNTFINMLAVSAKKMIIRKFFRKKNIIFNSERICDVG